MRNVAFLVGFFVFGICVCQNPERLLQDLEGFWEIDKIVTGVHYNTVIYRRTEQKSERHAGIRFYENGQYWNLAKPPRRGRLGVRINPTRGIYAIITEEEAEYPILRINGPNGDSYNEILWLHKNNMAMRKFDR